MDKIRILISGIGNRSVPKNPDNSQWYGWAEQFRRHPGFEVVGVFDPAPESRARAVERGVVPEGRAFADLDDMLATVKADAMLVSAPAEYHAQIAGRAVDENLHLLMEKPVVADLADGQALVDRISDKGLASMVIQNWRYKSVGLALQKAVRDGLVGKIGHIFFRYVRNRENPNYPDYIFAERYPLLYAMGIHHFDLFRYLLGEEIVSVRGHNFKPPWSMYESWTGHQLSFVSQSGVAIEYTGTISSQSRGFAQESLVVEGEHGTLVNDSDWAEPPLYFYPLDGSGRVDLTADVADGSTRGQYDVADEFIMNSFHKAVTTGQPSPCDAADGLRSLELVEAARKACESGEEVRLFAGGK